MVSRAKTSAISPPAGPKDWFGEKVSQLTGIDGLTAFGISIGVRDGSASMLVEQLCFTEMLAQRGVAQYVASVWFCHNAGMHEISSVGSLDGGIRDTIVEVARETLFQSRLDNSGAIWSKALEKGEETTPTLGIVHRRFVIEAGHRGQQHSILRDAAKGIRPSKCLENRARWENHHAKIDDQGRLLCPNCGGNHLFLDESFFFGFNTGSRDNEPLMLSHYGCYDCRGSFVLWTLSGGEGGHKQAWDSDAYLSIKIH